MKTANARQNVEFDVLAEVPNSIALLCQKERLEFWKFAAREVSNLRTPKGAFNAASLYDGLCAAVQENERKTPPKSGVNGIPRAVRRLSADELQKAVARHREKLLVNTGARRFLRDAFSRWVGAQKLDTLLSILDAFGLEHDEVGILTVPLREIDADEATNTLLLLREKLSSYELAVVCAGLMFNQSGWMPLLNAYFELCKAALSEQTAPVASASNLSEATASGGEVESNLASEVTNFVPDDLNVGPHAPAQAADFSMSDLQVLRESMNALARKLENAALLLGAGTYVDDDDIRIHWTSVATQLGQACEAIGRRSDQVAELEAHMLERERTSAAAHAAKLSLSRVTRVVHIADAAFTGCDEAKLFAEQLLAGSTTALAQEARVEALDALLKLVEPQGVLGDDEAAELGEKVKNEFGRSLATAALRGNLAIRAFENAKTLPAPSEDAHGEVSPMSSDVSVDVALAAKLDSQAGESSSVAALDRVAGHLDAASNFEEQPVASIEDVSSRQNRTIDEEVDAASPSSNPVVEELRDLTEPQVGATASAGGIVVAEPVIATCPSPIEAESTSVEPLIAFGDFKRAYWIGSNGRVVPAPWRSGGFYEGVARGALDAWRKGQFELALLRASTVADSDGTTTTLRLDDLRAASRLLDDPADTAVARDRTRSEYMRAALENVPPDRTLALALTLEALCPTFPFIFSTGEVAKLVSAAEFSTPALATVVEFLLNGWSAAADPLDVLRSHIEQHGAADPVALQAALIAAQKKLKSTSASLWSAAGGRLQQTHCRRAWTDFIESQVAPMRDMLIPLNQSGAAGNWSVQAARQRAEELVRSFARIMDSAGVRHQDRAAAIGAAEQIVAAIEDVINAKQRLVRAPRLPAATFGAMPVDQASQLLTDLPSDPLDRLGCRLFRAVIRRQAEANPFVVNAGALVTFPDLAAWVNAELLSSPQLTKGIPIASFSSLVAASAILDAADFEVFLNIPNDRAQLIADIRNVAVDADRSDILAALSPTDGLQANERTLLHRRALELGDRAYQQARRLEQAWAACDELLAPEAPRFRSLVDEALGVCSSNASETQVATSILLLHWLHEAVAATERARDEVAETRARQAHERSDEIGTEFKRLADSKNYRGAMALLNPDTSVSDHPTEMPRRTIWRKTAMERYSQPRSALIKDLRGVTEDQHLLISWWAQGDSNDSTYRDTLRRALYAVISGEAGRTQAENQRRFPVKLTELREHKERRTVISGSAIRDYFKHAKLNPSFLPQLADYPQIVLTTLLGSPQGGNSLDNYVKAASAEGQGALCVFLEPGIALGRRDEIVSGLRKRGLAAAVIDDIDLCRLCAIGADAEAHNFIPFLEIVFEQLDLELVSPFSSQDGQHVKIETFIGRAAAAHRIATGWEFSRVFSGRKLGKSAFLRHVANVYDQSKCQSGNDLDVIFITIAGGESEAWVVNCIIEEMSRRFQIPSEQESSTRLTAADRFTRYIKRFAETRPSRNVLLILDEADAFVEGQLAAYDKSRESSLSFRMMKELLPQLTDSTGMPRVRVVFSGYRVTNTRGGVWANAGDVLILTPLTEAEASLFLEGMLGRIGVDIGSHAPFAARRCGFQPAVLIRFGDSLLKRIRRSPRSNRESYQVSYDDVVATMSDQAVLDEIKTVVNNNFQSNRVAAAIFGATLLALKDLEPGLALDDGPKQVLKKLVEIDPNLDWMGSIGTPQLAQVERQMQEFIDRELLTVSDAPRFGVREYRLKFPHFLPVLTQQTDIAIDVRHHIQQLRSGGGAGRIVESVLSDSALDIARYWYRQDSVEFCSIVVAAGHWPRGLLDGKVGLPDRLGCNQPNVGMDVDGAEVASRVQGGTRVFGNVDADRWERYVAQSPVKPIVVIGGVDLLRVARQHVLAGHDRPVDVLSLGLLPLATLEWWFKEIRALHFASPDAVANIWRVTGGLPFLVGKFDALLSQPLAADVSAADFATAIEAFNGSLLDHALVLKSGDAHFRLTERELQLLRMAHIVAVEAQDEFDLELDFADCWNVCPKGALSEAANPMTDTTDRLSIQVLLDVGLLRSNGSSSSKATSSLGRVLIDSSGPVARLVKALERSSAS